MAFIRGCIQAWVQAGVQSRPINILEGNAEVFGGGSAVFVFGHGAGFPVGGLNGFHADTSELGGNMHCSAREDSPGGWVVPHADGCGFIQDAVDDSLPGIRGRENFQDESRASFLHTGVLDKHIQGTLIEELILEELAEDLEEIYWDMVEEIEEFPEPEGRNWRWSDDDEIKDLCRQDSRNTC